MSVFITGGSTGLGEALGKLFVQAGHKVGVCNLEAPEKVTALPEGFTYYQADITDEKAIQSAVDQFCKEHGDLDVMIANAGINMDKTTLPDIERGKLLTKINVMGFVNTFNSAFPYFINQKKGQFVGISSLSSLNGLPGMSYYGASKSFISMFCESLSIDLVEHNIYVTCIHPGFIKTSLTKANRHPMPFLMEKDEAAKRIFKAIQNKKPVLYLPLIPSLFMSLLRRLPRKLYFWIMKKDILNLKA